MVFKRIQMRNRHDSPGVRRNSRLQKVLSRLPLKTRQQMTCKDLFLVHSLFQTVFDYQASASWTESIRTVTWCQKFGRNGTFNTDTVNQMACRRFQWVGFQHEQHPTLVLLRYAWSPESHVQLMDRLNISKLGFEYHVSWSSFGTTHHP